MSMQWCCPSCEIFGIASESQLREHLSSKRHVKNTGKKTAVIQRSNASCSTKPPPATAAEGASAYFPGHGTASNIPSYGGVSDQDEIAMSMPWGCPSCGIPSMSSESQLREHLGSTRHRKNSEKKTVVVHRKNVSNATKAPPSATVEGASACLSPRRSTRKAVTKADSDFPALAQVSTQNEVVEGPTLARFCPVLGLESWLKPLSLEQATQEKAVYDRLESWSADRLVCEGLRLDGLIGQSIANNKSIRFFRPAVRPGPAESWFTAQQSDRLRENLFTSPLPRHVLAVGDVVLISNPSMPDLQSMVQPSPEGTADSLLPSSSAPIFPDDTPDRLEITSPPPLPLHLFSTAGRLVATVISVSSNFIDAVCKPGGDELAEIVSCNKRNNSWQLDKGFADTPFARMRDALGTLASPLGLHGAFDDLLALERLPSSQLQPSSVPRFPPPLLLELFVLPSTSTFVSAFTDEGLNANQQQALGRCLDWKKPIVLVHGPPGTGKSRLLATVVKHMIHDDFKRSPRVLVVAESNVAVDNVCLAILKGVDSIDPLNEPKPAKRMRVEDELGGETKMQRPPSVIVRVGKSSALSAGEPRLEAVNLATLADADPRNARVAVLRSGIKSSGKGKKKAERVSGWRAAKQLAVTIQLDVLKEARVVCSTIMGCGQFILKGEKFEVIVFDEACNCSVPAAAVALQRLSKNGRVIMAGDPLQLPPTVIDRAARTTGLGCSFFEFIAAQKRTEPTLLSIQYRMHPAIAHFPSRHFYGGKLSCSSTSAKAEISRLNLPRWPAPCRLGPVAFIEVPRPEVHGASAPAQDLESVDAYGSIQNASEVGLIVTIVRSLERVKALPASAVVLTPYEGQRALLSRVLVQHGSAVPVSTIDGFQGQEADLVIVSTVRSNCRGAVGFLDDWRRMNVALTRPRAGLLVVGSRSTLKNDPNWSAWLDWVDLHGAESPSMRAFLGLPETAIDNFSSSSSTSSSASATSAAPCISREREGVLNRPDKRPRPQGSSLVPTLPGSAPNAPVSSRALRSSPASEGSVPSVKTPCTPAPSSFPCSLLNEPAACETSLSASMHDDAPLYD